MFTLFSPRSKSGSRTGGPSSRNCTKTAKSRWSTAPTPATPWPAIPRPPPQCGRTAPRRPPRSTELRSRSRRTARRRHTWRIITTTGTSRDRTYSTRAPCTTQCLSRAWELFIDNDSRANSQFLFYFKRGLSTVTLQSKYRVDREAGLKTFSFWFLDDQELFFCFLQNCFPFSKHIRDFLITCGNVFNGQPAWFFKLFISHVVFPQFLL